MRRYGLAIAAACAALLIRADAARTAANPTSGLRALIVSIDGLRPDLLLRADVPRIRGLMARGAYTLTARTIDTPYTVPAHVTMLTGVPPETHGVTWNHHIEDAYPSVPTLLELAKRAGRTTAMVAGKSKLIVIAKPGTLDWVHIGDEGRERDADIARRAVQLIHDHRPEVMFLHLGDVDAVGHEAGWGSNRQIRALETADHAVGDVLDQLQASGIAGHTLVIVTADHGGSGGDHLPDDPQSLRIPWIVAGPTIRGKVEINGVTAGQVSIMTTFTVVSALLGLDRGLPRDTHLLEAITPPARPVDEVRALSAHQRR